MLNLIFRIERWKFNKNYNVYVSSEGRVKNKNKQLLQPNTNSKGYLMYRVEPNDKKKSKTILAHRLVMMTFKPLSSYKEMSVDHLDHNKRNNSLRNLEWVTIKENQRRAAVDYLDDKKIVKINEGRQDSIICEDLSVKDINLIKINGLTFTLDKAIELLWSHKNCTVSKAKVREQILNIANSDKNKKNKTYLGFQIEIPKEDKNGISNKRI